MEDLHLIVGLGNPGEEYARTRHNAGYLLVELLARNWRASWEDAPKLQSRVARMDAGGRRCLLCKPWTYMNESGVAVGAAAQYYRVPLDRMLVVADDADLPLGEIRLRPRGSSGGHHGLESVERHVGGREYARLRLGIGRRADGGRQITDHVLGRFNRDEAVVFEKVLDVAGEQVVCWLASGIEMAMNRYNGVAVAPAT